MGDNITAKRIEEIKGNMSQEDFATSIRSSQSAISKILSGEQSASLNVLTEIAKVYKVSIDWLLGLSSRKSIKGYSTFDEENPTTYADIVAFFVKLMRNKSISFNRTSENEDQEYGIDGMYATASFYDLVRINDHFIGDLLVSADSLLTTSPETVDSWLDKVVEDYDIPLLLWTRNEEVNYKARIKYNSSLSLLCELDKYRNK